MIPVHRKPANGYRLFQRVDLDKFRKSVERPAASHRTFTHANYPAAVTLTGQDDDAKKYQEKQVKRAIEEVER